MVEYRKLPSPLEIKELYKVQSHHRTFIENKRSEVRDILDGKDSRKLLIVGPCSIHDLVSAREYAIKLKHLARDVSDHFLVIMRTYFEKPRTSLGWKGLLYDPYLNSSHDIEEGLRLTRRLLLELTDLEVPTAAEFLEPAASAYFDDTIVWGCVGARTSASQTHRQMTSGLKMPIAFKNTTDGNVKTAINGIVSCSQPHTYMGIDQAGCVAVVQTVGNEYGHLVLRGSEHKTNYDPKAVSNALKHLKKVNLPLRLVIDCSHDNSHRRHEQQCQVFQSVIGQIIEGNQCIKGLLLESHIHAGNQEIPKDLSLLKYAVSLTDPCLDWDTTENLVRWAHQKIKNEIIIRSSFQKANADNLIFQKTC